MWTLWLHWYQPNNGILVFLWLPTCSLTPLPQPYSSIRTGPLVLHRTRSPSPTCASFFLSFSLSLPSPMGMANIFNRTKEMVAGSEKLERQLDGHGLEIKLHVFTFNTVCTSFSLCPHFFLSLSPHLSLSFDTLQCFATSFFFFFLATVFQFL